MTSPEQQKNGETSAKTLIQLGARINEPFTVDNHTVLHEAARFNRPDIVRYLIAAGADQSIADRHNTTVAEQLEIAKVAAQIKEEARQRKLAEERADPGLMMSVIAIAGATAQNYASAKQGSVPRQATSTTLNEAGRNRAATTAAGNASSTAARTASNSANAPLPQGYSASYAADQATSNPASRVASAPAASTSTRPLASTGGSGAVGRYPLVRHFTYPTLGETQNEACAEAAKKIEEDSARGSLGRIISRGSCSCTREALTVGGAMMLCKIPITTEKMVDYDPNAPVSNTSR